MTMTPAATALPWATCALAAWAEGHGLDFTPEGLLPPVTPHLALGHGAGPHRAGVVRSETWRGTRRSVTTTGGFTRRPSG